MQLFTSPPNRNLAPVVIPQDTPVYRVAGSGFYCDDELLSPGVIIQFEDEPNQDMEPMNELAMKKMREFLTKLDTLGRKKSEKDGVAFISALEAFEAIYNQGKGTKRANVLGAGKEAPILGARNKQSRVSKLEVAEATSPVVIEKMGAGRKAVNGATDTGLNKEVI